MSTLAMRNFNLLALLPEILGSKPAPKRQSASTRFTSAVNDISKFDLPYVYHHMHVGRLLSLHVDEGAVSVYYRAHKLGNLPFISSKRLVLLLEKGYEVQVKIKKLKKSQYLPIDDIQISMNFQMKS